MPFFQFVAYVLYPHIWFVIYVVIRSRAPFDTNEWLSFDSVEWCLVRKTMNGKEWHTPEIQFENSVQE